MQYILLLKGVNVGGRTLRMSELASCLKDAGFKNVVTVLQTGNVILESSETNVASLRTKIEALLTQSFHYPAKILIYTPAILQRLVSQNPFTKKDPEFHRYLLFTEKGAAAGLIDGCERLDESVETIGMGEDCVYWQVKKGNTLKSRFGLHMSKIATKQLMTNRNVNTLERILRKCADPDDH